MLPIASITSPGGATQNTAAMARTPMRVVPRARAKRGTCSPDHHVRVLRFMSARSRKGPRFRLLARGTLQRRSASSGSASAGSTGGAAGAGGTGGTGGPGGAMSRRESVIEPEMRGQLRYVVVLLRREERDAYALASRAPGSSHPVHAGLAVARRVQVHHERDTFNVDAARC